jgi:hypothetical protein
MAGFCEYDNESLSGSMKGAEFLDQMSDYQYLKDSPAPWNYS